VFARHQDEQAGHEQATILPLVLGEIANHALARQEIDVTASSAWRWCRHATTSST